MDQNGTPGQEYIVTAVKGTKGYVLIVDVPAAVDATTPSLAQGILGSFQLTATTVASAPSSSPVAMPVSAPSPTALTAANTTAVPHGVSIAPDPSDARTETVTDARNFSFDVAAGWTFDPSYQAPLSGVYRMISPDGLLSMIVTAFTDPNTPHDVSAAAYIVTGRLNADRDGYLNFRLRQQPDAGLADSGWSSIAMGEDRFTGDDGVDESHVYTVGIGGSLVVTLDWIWAAPLPGSELLRGDLTYLGATAPATSSSQPSGAPKPSGTPSGAIIQASGAGPQSTQAFTVPAKWSVHYTYDCSQFLNVGILGGLFSVMVYDSDNSLSTDNQPINVNAFGGTGGSTQSYQSGGSFYLSVFSICPWTLSVTAP